MNTSRRSIQTGPGVWLLTLGILLCLAPVEGYARPPRARELQCVIQTIEHNSHTMMLQCGKDAALLELAWTKETKFLKNWKFADAAPLKAGQAVVVCYRSPFFGKKFATKVVWQNGSDEKANNKNEPSHRKET